MFLILQFWDISDKTSNLRKDYLVSSFVVIFRLDKQDVPAISHDNRKLCSLFCEKIHKSAKNNKVFIGQVGDETALEVFTQVSDSCIATILLKTKWLKKSKVNDWVTVVGEYCEYLKHPKFNNFVWLSDFFCIIVSIELSKHFHSYTWMQSDTKPINCRTAVLWFQLLSTCVLPVCYCRMYPSGELNRSQLFLLPTPVGRIKCLLITINAFRLVFMSQQRSLQKTPRAELFKFYTSWIKI